MRPLPKALLVAMSVGVVGPFISSCAHNPRIVPDPEAFESIQAQYLAEYPEGRFNDRIVRHEIQRGMNLVEVLASWGLPQSRREDRSTGREIWSYVARADEGPDYVVYRLSFEDRLLRSWGVERSTAASGGLPPVLHPGLEPGAPLAATDDAAGPLRVEGKGPRK